MADPRFLDPLDLEYIDGRNWKVVSAFDYHTDVQLASGPTNGQFVVHILAGFITDFASVPRLLWNIFSPTGSYGKAAVVHDYLYRMYGLATKTEADDVFDEAMKVLGTGWWTRQCLYYAVHFFGHRSYKGGIE